MTGRPKLTLVHVASSHIMGLTNQETHLALAYQALDAVHISVVCGEKEQVPGCFYALETAGIPIVIINGFDEHNQIWRLVTDFRAWMDRLMPDIVSVNTNWQIVIAALARLSGRQRYKIIYTIHGFRHNHPVKSILARFLIGALLFLFADAINAPSGYVRDKFSFLRYKTKSAPLGEDNVFFLNSAPPDFTMPLSFCFAGQFREGKNQSMLIEAFAEYLVRTNDRQAKLVLPGEGGLLSRCISLASTLGVSNHVLFPGQINRSEMVRIYKDCQVAIVPTNSETFGHCIAEPMVMRRIVLSRPVGIAPDVIIHGVNGFIFSTKSQLVDLMTAIRAMSVEKLMQIADHAGETGQQFNWATVAKKNVENLMRPMHR